MFETTIAGKPAVVEYEPDSDLRDTEQVPLLEEGGIDAFIQCELLPYVPDAWFDPSSTGVGYQLLFNEHFTQFENLRSLREIQTDVDSAVEETEGLLDQILIKLQQTS